MRRPFQLLALSLALGAPPVELSAKAEPTDLSGLPLEALMEIEVPRVFGASKLEQKVTEAPSYVTIVDSDEIKRYGYRTLADILESAPGFNVSYDRNYTFLGASGVSLGDFNSRVLLLIDGHRVNNNLTDGAYIGTEFILDIDLIDRVEIIRGPGSVLYGNNAFLGVINVITRQPQQVNGVEVSGEYGSFDTYKARLTYGKLFTNGVSLLLSGTYFNSEGQDALSYKEFNTPAQNNGVARNMDGESYESFFGSLGYGDFSLEGAFINREKVNPTAQFGTTFNDPRLRTIDQDSYATLRYVHSFDEVVDVAARIYYDQSDYEIGYPYGATLYTERDVGEWAGAEVQLSKRLWDRHVLTLGAEYRDDFRQASRVFDQNTTYTDINTNRQSYGVYFQGDFALLTNLHFTAGLRYDQVGDFDPAFNPRLALIYNPFTKSTLKAIYGSAFRAPNFSELSDPRFQDIKPEEIKSYELVYEQEIGRHLRSTVSGFYNQMHDLIVFQSGQFNNMDADTTGLELALEGRWASGIRGQVSYSLQRTTDESVAWQMPDSPNHMVKLNLSVPILRDKLFAGVEVLFTDSRLSLLNTTDARGQPLTVQGETAGAYGLVNLTLFSQHIVKNLELSASIYNLLNQSYGDPASRYHVQDIIEQDGRSFRLKLTYRF